jgi:hypothetical protein
MNKLLRWILLLLVVLALAAMLVGRHYVLSSKDLSEAIQEQLPTGSSKAKVNNFVEARHPVAYEDMGSMVKARLSGRADNIIYRKDIVVSFNFDAQGRLSSYSTKEYLTFF